VHWWGIEPLQSAFLNAPKHRPDDGDVGRCDNLAEGGTDALAGDRRGPNEEPELALAGNDDRIGLRSGRAEPDQRNFGASNRNRRQRVQHNAQLAMICVGLAGVKVSNLAHGEKRQQDEAHARDYQREFPPGAALCAEMCQKSCQLGKPRRSYSTSELI